MVVSTYYSRAEHGGSAPLFEIRVKSVAVEWKHKPRNVKT